MEYSRDCTSTDQGSGLQCNREIETSVLSGRLETQLYTCGTRLQEGGTEEKEEMIGNNGTLWVAGDQGGRSGLGREKDPLKEMR